MKVLSINKFYWKKGGSETVFFGEKELLEDAGNEVIPFSMKSAHNHPTPYEKYFVNEVNYGSPSLSKKIDDALKIIYSFEARKKINELLKHHKIDIAHFHIFQHQISPSVFGPIRERRIPLVLTLHDLKPLCPNYKMYTNGEVCERCKDKKFYNAFINRCTKGSRLKSLINTVEMYLHYALGYYKGVDRYIAVSKFYREKMIEYGFAPEKVSYLPNFIDIKKFPSGIKDDNYAVFFGRLSHEKGIDILIDAAKQCPEIVVKVIGTGPIENDLKQKAEKEGIPNIDFLGFKAGSDLKTLISNASFSIIPSRWYENCPMSVLESFAMSTPVIGANIGGIPELIDNGVDGLVFTPGDATDLAKKMREMWNSPAKRKAMGHAGREKMARDFSPKRHLEGLLSIYESVVT